MSYLWSPGLTPSSVQQTNECWNTIRLTLNRSRNRLDVWPWPVLSLGSWIKILNLWFVVSLYGKSRRLMKLGCNKSQLGPCRGSQMLSDVSRRGSGWGLFFLDVCFQFNLDKTCAWKGSELLLIEWRFALLTNIIVKPCWLLLLLFWHFVSHRKQWEKYLGVRDSSDTFLSIKNVVFFAFWSWHWIVNCVVCLFELSNFATNSCFEETWSQRPLLPLACWNDHRSHVLGNISRFKRSPLKSRANT